MYLGNQPALSYTSFAKQDFTTSATTSYTLDYSVANANEIALFINFVRQEPTTAYSASGTSLTLTSATSASDDMYAVFLGKAVQTVNPPASSVGLSQLSATGTKDSTTFLRGDNTFATPSGGKVLQYQSAQLTSSLSTTSTSYVDATGLSVSITPASTSNKILILFTGCVGNNGNTSNTFLTVLRGTTNLASDVNNYFFFNSAGTRIYAGASLHFVDEPNTSSATTYKIQYRIDGSSTGYILDKARLTLMELSA